MGSEFRWYVVSETMLMLDAAFCYRQCSVVCLYVCLLVTFVSPAKNGWIDRDAIWLGDSGVPEELVLDVV